MRVVSSNGLATRLFAIAASLPVGAPGWQTTRPTGSRPRTPTHIVRPTSHLRPSPMRIYIGTSGFSYAPWRGSFYPEKLPATKMLAYYAERLDAVEINNTFYRMPAPDMLAKWAVETPVGFQFALKSPRRITHEKKLADVADSLTRLREAAGTLGERLGPVLFQLPPFMKKDVPRLQEFVAQLPPGLRAALEFR